MNILITGGSGLLGTSLTEYFRLKGHFVQTLSHVPRKGAFYLDCASDTLLAADNEPLETLKEVDAVLHFSGRDLFTRRWNKREKQLLKDSRVAYTQSLKAAFEKAELVPKTLVSASAMGYYGCQALGGEAIDEEGDKAEGFLSDLTAEWEESSLAFQSPPTKVVLSRTGIVLHRDKGALGRLLPFFRWGLGGVLGTGEQAFNWVHIKDVCRAVEFMLENEGLEGPVNLVGPHPSTYKEFAKTLSKVLQRPCFFPLPNRALRILLGEAANILLEHAPIRPRKLLCQGFKFHYSNLQLALRDLLKAPRQCAL